MFDEGDTVYSYEAQEKIRVCDEIPAVRRAFAAKVLGQTAALLLLVAVICAAGMGSSDETQAYLVGRGRWMFYLAVAVSFAIVLSYFCSSSMLHRFPHKYVGLVVFGAAIGVQCMYATLQYTASSVLMVAGITASAALVLAIYASRTSADLTGWGPCLGAALWVLIAFGFLQIWFHDRVLQVLYGSLGALVFSVYLVVDIQMVIGGQHRMQYGLDDDVLATIGIFLDIINLFLHLLSLLGDRRD